MADISLTTYGKGIDLQVSSSAPSWEGSIYNGGTYTTFNQGTLAKGLVSGSSLLLKGGSDTMDGFATSASLGLWSSASDTEAASQTAVKAYVDAQVSAGNDLSVQADNGGLLTVDLATDDFNITGSSNFTISGSKEGTEVNFEVCLADDVTIAQSLTVTGILTANGNVDLGNATSDTITATGRFDSDLVPSSDSARDLGTSALQWADVHADAGYIDAMTVTGLSTLGAVTATGIINLSATGVATTVKGTLNVDEAATFDTTLGVTGITSGSAAGKFLSLALNTNKFEVDSSGNCDTSGYVIADGRGMFGGRLDVTGAFDCANNAQIDGTLDVTGDTSVSTFDSSGATSIATGGATVEINTSGNRTNINGTLTVDEAATFSSTIDSTGIVSGSAAGKFLSLALNTNNFEVDSSGNCDTSGYVIADGRGMFGGRLDVTGAFDCANNAQIDGTLDVTGDTSVSTFDSSGATSLATGGGTVTLCSAGVMTTIEGTLNVDEAATFDTTVGITGLATCAGGITVSAGNLTMTSGDITCSDVNSEVKAGAFVTYSDAALKTNVETVTNAMDMIQGLRGVSYDLKSGGKREYGFIAQEVSTVVPEVVSTSGNLMGIDYTRITSLLVEAVKTQQAEIIALKEKLDK
jgi:hypothetical protein